MFWRNEILAWGIEIRSTDSHAIFDIKTGERINNAANIDIGDKVWVAAKVTILKGTYIASGGVVGINTLVSGSFQEENSLTLGNPGRLARTGIRWERPLLG